MWGTPSSTPTFGTPSSTPAFGTPSSTITTPAFGTPSTPSFASPSFATPSSTPSFSTPFASTSSLFSSASPFSQQQRQQQQHHHQQQQPTPSLFSNVPHLTTQMAPVAPFPPPLLERDVQAVVDAYKEDPSNPKYSFRHLLFSVTDPMARAKPLGVSDIMWAEAMGKLEGMESANRERLWPQLVQSFKDLSNRLKLQDEVIVSDADRLKITQKNVKMLQRHFQADTLPWIQRLRQREQCLQRRLLRIMRIVEALEGRGPQVPLARPEVELGEKLSSIARQLKAPGNGLSLRVHNLLRVVQMHANAGGVGSSVYLPRSTKIDEQSLADLQEVLQQQIEAIAKMGNVLKRDARDMEIILSEAVDVSRDRAQRSL